MSHSPGSFDEPLTKLGRRFLVLWGLVTAALLSAATVLTVMMVSRDRAAAFERHEARIDPRRTETGLTAAEAELPAGAQPHPIRTGIYLERIRDVSIHDAAWTAVFELWFLWQGEADWPVEEFEVVDGEIDSRTLQTRYDDGPNHYVRYRVVARITKSFDIARFPCDDHLLTIGIEYPSRPRDEWIFVPDEDSGISSRVQVAGYTVVRTAAIEKPHAYRTGFGDARLPPGTRRVHSQFRFGTWIQRPGWGFYWRMFYTLYVAVTIALLAFFIPPTSVDPRFGLGIGALFGAVANSYITASLVPDAGELALADLINLAGIFMILLTLLQSTISLHLYDRRGRPGLSKRFDRVSFAVFAAGYVAFNLAVPLAAQV